VVRLLPLVALTLLGCGCDETPARDGATEARLEKAEARISELESRLAALETMATVDAPPIELPRVDKPVSTRIVIALGEDQTLVDGEAVASVALRAHLEALAAKQPDASVMLRADDDVDYARVVSVMDTIKKAGFDRIAVATPADD